MFQQIWMRIGPMTVSAFSLYFTSLGFQLFISSFFDQTFNMLASKGLGKVIFTSLVIIHVGLLVALQSKKFIAQWRTTNLYFLVNIRWLKPFFMSFSLFFMLHTGIILGLLATGYLRYNAAWHAKPTIFVGILFGFFVTFMLAWTEELIFRGSLYLYFAQYVCPLTGILITSFIFMLAHNILNPLALITHDWKLGLGLFLLGILLNLIFALTNTLYVGMGAHAGLVFVKVILRRIPLVVAPQELLPWWFTKDLRESHLIHLLFLIFIITLIVRYKKKLLTPHQETV